MPDFIIPGAVTVAVTSGKGGVGKTSTAVALAIELAQRDLDVIVIDGDIAGPNVHLLADVTNIELGVDTTNLELNLPESSYGFRVVTPASIGAGGRVSATDLIGMAQFASPADVVIVDLPPGWTPHHETFAGTLPDLIVAAVAPTEAAISDHRAHLAQWQQGWTAAVNTRKERDRRRKVNLPEAPTVVTVETMARFTGIPDTGGDPVTIRRIDALPADQVATLVDPVVSIPASATLRDSAATVEVGQLGAIVSALLEPTTVAV